MTGNDTDRDTVVSIRSAPPTQHPLTNHLRGRGNHGNPMAMLGNGGDSETGAERIEVRCWFFLSIF